ncbi:MAG TPA: DUF1553 domain-containing protein [Gemmataceae bacterium]|nr:DUF1553 domain-containing protein [Gemmataceae bacterium]
MTRGLLILAMFSLPAIRATAAGPLHRQIDNLIAAAGKGKPASAISGDGEFLRRIYLDLAGRIPSVEEARVFLHDASADKRARLIDRLLSSPDYPRHMQEQFHIALMERLGDNADWSTYLLTSFEKNKPWGVMAREILSGTREPKGAAFFLSKRLEHYGENPVDYPGLTRDIGRLFLGVNLQCAQCHDHLFVSDYKQADFQGLLAFVQYVAAGSKSPPSVVEKTTTKKIAYSSVFDKIQKETGPRLPGMKEVPIPSFKPGEEWATKPDQKKKTPGTLKFSTLAKLAEQMTDAQNPAFARNFANRLWFLLLGRGLVHPLDLRHGDNPPSHPKLLDLLAREAVARKYDIKSMLREIALSQTYQRSSILPSGQTAVDEAAFLTAHEKRLSAEQLLRSVLEATGEKERLSKSKGGIEALKVKFVKAFANAAREPEEEYAPALRSALFLSNDHAVLDLLKARPGNLVGRASKMADDKAVEELYLATLTRQPTADEKAALLKYLTANAGRREAALSHLAWALLASTEFCLNH